MTKSGSIFSATVTLTPGVHEYKFVVDGNWITDPGNAKVGGYDNNSVLVVPSGNAPQDNGKVTVKILNPALIRALSNDVVTTDLLGKTYHAEMFFESSSPKSLPFAEAAVFAP